MNATNSVCAVIVTYNRKALLRECLTGLKNQSRPLERILVVNNLSTDGTGAMLEEEFPDVSVLSMKSNLGGAGGFKVGMQTAHEQGFDWIWVMDDDAEPRVDTLERLLAAASTLQTQAGYIEKPLALCPLIWGVRNAEAENYHHKTIDHLFRERPVDLSKESGSIIPIDANAFVGPLFNRFGMTQLGLPRDEYFLWCDDTEYTYRFSQRGGCFLVKDAVINHKDVPGPVSPAKIFYWRRNYTDFILRRGSAYARDRSRIQMRSLLGFAYFAMPAIQNTTRYAVASLVKRRNSKLKDNLLPLLGLLHGITGKKGPLKS